MVLDLPPDERTHLRTMLEAAEPSEPASEDNVVEAALMQDIYKELITTEWVKTASTIDLMRAGAAAGASIPGQQQLGGPAQGDVASSSAVSTFQTPSPDVDGARSAASTRGSGGSGSGGSGSGGSGSGGSGSGGSGSGGSGSGGSGSGGSGSGGSAPPDAASSSAAGASSSAAWPDDAAQLQAFLAPPPVARRRQRRFSASAYELQPGREAWEVEEADGDTPQVVMLSAAQLRRHSSRQGLEVPGLHVPRSWLKKLNDRWEAAEGWMHVCGVVWW